MINYIQEVNKNVNIQEGKQAIENILLNIYFKEGISNKELSRNNLLPIPVIVAIKKEFIKYGLLVQDRGVRLTKEGLSFIENRLGFRGIRKDLYMKLLKETWEEEQEITEVKRTLSEVFINRPLADVTIDQSKCTLDTAVKRAVLCLQNYALVGRNILCVGDDDLVSVALGFLLKKLFANIEHCNTTIYVVDIDNRVLTYIKDIAEKERLPIKCVCSDFRKPLSKDFTEQFDCFFTDPPYTLDGMNLFLSRGIEALKKQNGLPIFLSYAHKSPDFEFAMQQCFVDMGLIVSKVMTRFNTYEGAEIIGNTGQMIVLKTTSKSKTLMESFYQGPLYTGELKKTVRLYKCKSCGQTIKVGLSEKIKTIEELKSKGCSKCSNQTFNLIDKNKL
ncbi:bis-aminopropyl spermidine synthase family protein [Alkaliphilus sp. B6464]|uniref:bis-aminopropyl spermidine synthase family protein n=1 Tax=Alkaliphilus sp. B6464 TaxID=2731219 RepID=UPI001BAA7158|nr:bis-aminopropyl spermidine synthase family protein [Alkaliphilus sp. B6464]QUH18818.1 bis-aminopropyl spermidine synthase family protein [Alkaliphilus sp. B6464]